MARTLPAASRRDFLYQCAAGLGGVALSAPLHREQAWAGLVSPRPRPAGKAKACIFLLMEGGPSHIDTFDPKPELERFHMTRSVEAGKRRFVKSPFLFRRAGQSGAGICTLFEHLSECIDDICFYRGAVAESTNHLAALHHLNTGSMFAGSPAIGARVAHSLGNGSGNLPAFVVLPDAEYPCGGAANWSNGFLPPGCRGSAIRPATIGLEKEPEATRRMYGVGEEVTDALGRRCLHARRLVERGVCLVQVHCGGWDSHDDIETSHGNCMRSVDRPVAALLKDLKRTL